MNFDIIPLGPFTIKIYGLLLAIIFTLFSWQYYKKITKKKLGVEVFVHRFWLWVLSGIVFGRVVEVLLNLDMLTKSGLMGLVAFWENGLNPFGVALGVTLMMLWDLRKSESPIISWFDAGILPFFFALMLIDIAGFLTGAIYGLPSDLPWAITYETMSVSIVDPVHPVTLYALLLHILVFRYLKSNEKGLLRTPGRLTIYGLIFYCLINIFVLFLRGDESHMILSWLRLDQLLHFIAIIGLYVLGKFILKNS